MKNLNYLSCYYARQKCSALTTIFNTLYIESKKTDNVQHLDELCDELCKKHNIEKSVVEKMLKNICDEYKDEMDSAYSFENLILTGVFRRQDVIKVMSKYKNLSDLSELTLMEFLKIDATKHMKTRILHKMVENQLPLKDKTCKEIEEYLVLLDNI